MRVWGLSHTGFRHHALHFRLSGVWFEVPSLNFWVHGSGVFDFDFPVNGSGFSGFEFRCFGSRVSGFGFRVYASCFGFGRPGERVGSPRPTEELKLWGWNFGAWSWGLGVGVRGEGLEVSFQGFGFRVQGLGFRVWSLGVDHAHRESLRLVTTSNRRVRTLGVRLRIPSLPIAGCQIFS
jgi:hypothetical protein